MADGRITDTNLSEPLKVIQFNFLSTFLFTGTVVHTYCILMYIIMYTFKTLMYIVTGNSPELFIYKKYFLRNSPWCILSRPLVRDERDVERSDL